MTTNFDQSAAVTLFPSMAASFGQTIVFHRGAESVNVTGIKTDPAMFESDDTNIYVSAEANDFMILASSLILNSVEVKPQKDDYLTIGTNEYLIVSAGEGFYTFADPAETIIRVTTRRIN